MLARWMARLSNENRLPALPLPLTSRSLIVDSVGVLSSLGLQAVRYPSITKTDRETRATVREMTVRRLVNIEKKSE